MPDLHHEPSSVPSAETLQWLNSIEATLKSYRRMIDALVAQLSDHELHQRLAPEFNSVATLLRHLGGNLSSRWTDFLTTDGEKPDRDREQEFEDWPGDRQSLLEHFDRGWQALVAAVELLKSTPPEQSLTIRGERHSVQEALLRSLTHLTYHVGQISLIARWVHQGQWQWLTIAPGESSRHNQANWGKNTSRGILGSTEADAR